MAFPIAAVLALAQVAMGAIQKGKADKEKKQAEARQQALFSQRKSYKTPVEMYQYLNAVTNRAQSGFDPATLDYLTTQSDRALSSSVSAAEYLGADPNALSSIFTASVDNTMRIGAENHAQYMKNFDSYLGALEMIGKNKDAEWQSGENLIKDRLQAEQAQRVASTMDSANGLNEIIGGVANLADSTLYNTDSGLDSDGQTRSERRQSFQTNYGNKGQWRGAFKYAKKNSMSYSEYNTTYNKNLSLLGATFR